METTKRKRTREEVRAAVRETIRRKKEWIEKTNKEFEMIRNGELKLKYSELFISNLSYYEHIKFEKHQPTLALFGGSDRRE